MLADFLETDPAQVPLRLAIRLQLTKLG